MADETPEDNYLAHIGIIRKSGRYPWGSGKDPFQRSKDFKAYLEEMRNTIDPSTGKRMTDTAIAKAIQEYANKGVDPSDRANYTKFTSSDLRAAISTSTTQIRNENIKMARSMRDKRGMSPSAIAREMLGSSSKESTVRGWLADSQLVKDKSVEATVNVLKDEVAAKQFLDVGKGTHLELGITHTKLLTALAALRDEGYEVRPILVPQLGMADKMTRYKILAKAGTSWESVRQAVLRGDLKIISAQSDDGGQTYTKAQTMPVSVKSKRITVRHAEDGGTKMDGVIELRRGVEDLDLGSNRYAQVRVAVDGTHYMKGMAMYADDLPAGVDMRFNSNKPASVGKLGAMKPMEKNPDGTINMDNPFGSTTHPLVITTKSGKEITSPLNVVGAKGRGNIEGRWDQWSKNLSSQMLSKQPVALISSQLGKARKSKEQDLKDIMALTNPVLKKTLLDEFADGADAAAVHLKAAQMPRQSTHVILPMNSMRPTEIYAPAFNHGEKVVLVRHPHAGPFEIPELTVNNNNRTAKRILQNAMDAVGIHHSVAEQLSGADFDGDTVLVIPNDAGKVKTQRAIPELASFDPKVAYKISDTDTTTKRMSPQNTQTEMGKISNLITDMSLQKAPKEDMIRAVQHSMVVIDAEKHGLDYQRSAKDNNIAQLKTKYQGKANAGAATLISKANAEKRVPQRKYLTGKSGVDPVTGDRVYVETGRKRTVTDSKGRTKEIDVETVGTRMGFAKDARDLLSGKPDTPLDSRGLPQERIYAEHANSLKDLARTARLASLNTEMPRVSPGAKQVYHKEIASLDAKLKIAQRNAPLERRAQVLGNAIARDRIAANPTLDKDDIRKIQYEALAEGRAITGASKVKVYIDVHEWRAIQAGAVAHSRLAEIFRNSDLDRVRELATPRTRTALTPGQMARARSMMAGGRNPSEIAEALGIPRSTLVDNLGE